MGSGDPPAGIMPELNAETPSADDSIQVPETVEEAVAEQPVDEPEEEKLSEPEGEEDPFEAAISRAANRVAGEAESPDDTQAEEAGDETQEEAAQEEPTAEQPAASSPEKATIAQLNRIISLVSEGREGELDSESRGLLRALQTRTRAEVEQEAQQEEQFKGYYLNLLEQKEDDPEAFAQTLLGEKGDQIRQFMRWYEESHPGVSRTSPDVPLAKRVDVEKEAYERAVGAIDDAVTSITREFGLTEDTLSEVYQKSGGQLSKYLTGVVDTLAEKRTTEAIEAFHKTELPKILEKEREALRTEEQAKWVKQNVRTPRSVQAAPSGRVAPRRQPTGDIEKDFDAAANAALSRVREAWG